MGTLQYDGLVVEFDDRLLAHLQIVIVQKIRRGESFLMSWRDSLETGSGHSAIWIHPSQNLFFRFAGSRNPTINQEWIDQLLLSANSSRGLLVMREGSAENPPTGEIATATTMRRSDGSHHAKADPQK
ncbi:ATP-dependent DNA ligase [Homoserinimonas hongtaonis]|uniref:DUF7882 family protein n=1 Tax=Homoserinimonas hongtaonis TaxID=2079791 RepID=UPI0018EECA56|nr:ATP-dependent DNA ligase [Salinibacterium hongtaonis]